MKIIDGKNAVMGRLASYAAKELIKGEEIVVVNCEKVLITGNRKDIEEKYKEKRSKVGSGQKGPKVSRSPHMIVKRAVRGMLPNFRTGRGREAYKRLRCYSGVPREFESGKKISAGKQKGNKFIRVGEVYK